MGLQRSGHDPPGRGQARRIVARATARNTAHLYVPGAHTGRSPSCPHARGRRTRGDPRCLSERGVRPPASRVTSLVVSVPIRVIVGEDHYLVREGLRQLRSRARHRGSRVLPRPAVARVGHRRGSARRRGHRHPHAAARIGRGHPLRHVGARCIPNSASSCSASTPTPSTRSVSSKEVRPGAPTCSVTGSRMPANSPRLIREVEAVARPSTPRSWRAS